MKNKDTIKVVENTPEKAVYQVVDETGAETLTLSISKETEYRDFAPGGKGWGKGGDFVKKKGPGMALTLTSNGIELYSLIEKGMSDAEYASYDNCGHESHPVRINCYEEYFIRKLVKDESKEATAAKLILQQVNGLLVDNIKQEMSNFIKQEEQERIEAVERNLRLQKAQENKRREEEAKKRKAQSALNEFLGDKETSKKFSENPKKRTEISPLGKIFKRRDKTQ